MAVSDDSCPLHVTVRRLNGACGSRWRHLMTYAVTTGALLSWWPTFVLTRPGQTLLTLLRSVSSVFVSVVRLTAWPLLQLCYTYCITLLPGPGFIGFICPGDDDINRLLILIFDYWYVTHIIGQCSTHIVYIIRAYNSYKSYKCI